MRELIEITNLEEKERDDCRRFGRNRFREVERLQKRGCMHKGWEQCQNGEDVELRDKEKFCWVHVVPVTKFMSYSKVVYDELCQSN